MDIVQTVVSLGALALIIASICVKHRRLAVLIQGASCGLQLIFDLLIGAFSAAAGELVDVVRAALFVYKEKFSQGLYLGMLIFFELIIVVSCFLAWGEEGAWALLPTIATMFRTYAAWQTRMGVIRIAGVVTGLLYVPYFLAHNSIIMAVGYGVLLVVGIFEVWHHRDLQGGDGCSPDDQPLKPATKKH